MIFSVGISNTSEDLNGSSKLFVTVRVRGSGEGLRAAWPRREWQTRKLDLPTAV